MFAGRDGRIMIPFRLTGTFTDPELSVELGSMTDRLRDAAEAKVREEAKKLGAEAVKRGREEASKRLKGGAGKAVDRLLGGGKKKKKKRGGGAVKKARDLLGF